MKAVTTFCTLEPAASRLRRAFSAEMNSAVVVSSWIVVDSVTPSLTR